MIKTASIIAIVISCVMLLIQVLQIAGNYGADGLIRYETIQSLLLLAIAARVTLK